MTVTCVVTFGDEDADRTALRWVSGRSTGGGDTVTTAAAGDLRGTAADPAVDVYVAGSPARHDDHDDLRTRIVEFAGRSPKPVTVVRAVPADHDITDRTSLPVIAGVPRSASAWSLLDFAAAEAEAGGVHLALVRVWRDSDWETSMTRDQAASLDGWRAADRERLDTAAEYVRATRPGLEVVTQLREGNVWDFLTDAGSVGRMVVLGTTPRDREGLGAWAVSHLTVPVALVPATADVRPVAEELVPS